MTQERSALDDFPQGSLPEILGRTEIPLPMTERVNRDTPTASSLNLEIVNFIGTKFRMVATPINDAGTGENLYVYENGVYRPGISDIRSFVFRLLGDRVRIERMNEILNLIRELHKIPFEETNKDADTLINVENGLIDVRSGALLSHDPGRNFLIQINARFDPTAQSERVDQFLHEVLHDDAFQIFQEVLGYLLVADTSQQVAFIVFGRGGNGKSVFLKAVIRLLGEQNISSVALQALTEDRFAKAQLFGKFANIFPDLPARGIEDTSIFKMSTDGHIIEAQKKFGQPFKFKNEARLLFSCNELPKSADLSDAFFRRWVILEFPNSFAPGKADPGLVEKLTTPEARSAWLNHALTGLRRLREQGHFTIPASVKRATDQYRLHCDSALSFLKERTARISGARTPKQILFDAYVKWCGANGIKPDSQTRFNAAVEKEYRETRDGDSRRAWGDLGITDDL